jgi:hypothetical protein
MVVVVGGNRFGRLKVTGKLVLTGTNATGEIVLISKPRTLSSPPV